MKHLTLLLTLLLPLHLSAQQKLFYTPDTLKSIDFNNPQSQWSWSHSAQTENIVYLWERDFGFDPYNAPKLNNQPMTFDLGNIQIRLEQFYRFFRDSLQFTLPGSIADKYKMMVMLNYSLESTAYGGTYDDFIGALWVSPCRIQDKKLNCLAHELGHCFQLQIIADKTGEAWGGSGFFEMTSQWMLWLVNPDWPTDENYHLEAFKKLTHKGFLHIENIYHSPYVLQWWAEQHGLTSIAQLYREGKTGEDPATTYMRLYNLSQSQFCDDIFQAYQHLLNFDFQHAHNNTRPYACSFNSPTTTSHQWTTPDSIPENYGFNAIKLNTPAPGQTVTAQFKSLAQSLKSAGFRYSFVAITTDDHCLYPNPSSAPTSKISFTAPTDKPLKALYFLVMGAPTSHDPNPASRQFPYKVKFSTKN